MQAKCKASMKTDSRQAITQLVALFNDNYTVTRPRTTSEPISRTVANTLWFVNLVFENGT